MADEQNVQTDENDDTAVEVESPTDEAAEAEAEQAPVDAAAEEPAEDVQAEPPVEAESPAEVAAEAEAAPAPEEPASAEPDSEGPDSEGPTTDEPAPAEPEAKVVAEAKAKAEQEKPAAAAARKKKKRLPRSLRAPRTKLKREKPAERKSISRLPSPEHDRGRSQERQGTVVSAAMDKTIVVRVDMVKVHPRYKKVIRRSSRFHAHDERNEAKVGDIVLIVETRPLSRMKRWRLQQIVEAAR